MLQTCWSLPQRWFCPWTLYALWVTLSLRFLDSYSVLQGSRLKRSFFVTCSSPSPAEVNVSHFQRPQPTSIQCHCTSTTLASSSVSSVYLWSLWRQDLVLSIFLFLAPIVTLEGKRWGEVWRQNQVENERKESKRPEHIPGCFGADKTQQVHVG